MKTRLLATLLLLAALPVAAQINDTYVIPAAANGSGDAGTRWMTQFSLFNPQFDYPLTISVTFIPTGGARGTEKLITVPANSLAYSDNLLLDLYGIAGGGSLLVATFPEDNPGVPNDVLSRSFLVTSNTYNNAKSGTFGQTINGIWTGLLDYDSDGISAIAHGIRNSNRTGFRTNVGAVNLGRCYVTMLVNVYDADGRTLRKDIPFDIPPMAHYQDRLPVETDAATLEFFIDDPCTASDANYAVVFPYTSTIDGRSGDPAYQSPTLLATPNTIFAKTMKALSTDPTTIGKKIGSDYARGVRALAEHAGKAQLARDDKGWKISQ